MRYLLSALFITLLLPAINAWSQQTDSSTSAQPQQQAPKQVDVSPLRELGGNYHNSIKLLQNRFRIDYEVDEITMVFFREFGSAPVVLVQPDGSKIFQGQADGENIFWYDATTYDLISIKDPTPGPWQAVGQILPESRVMVLSDVRLHADQLPDIIFSGEILKQTARLTNGGDPIRDPEFRDVVSLDIRLVSTNNPNYNNFGADIQTIATFEDNGRGMDEEPLDGVFTGQFNLAVPDGEWTPVFVVNTPLFTREQVDDPLMLYPNPIKISHELDGGGDGYHKLIVDSEREHVDMNTLLIDGKVRFPNGDVHNFSLTEQSPDAREHLIVNYDYGVYRVKLTVYGNTNSGRDFILDVPEYTFLVETPLEEIPVATDANGEPVDADVASIEDALAESPESAVAPVAELVDEPLPVPEAEPEMSTGMLVGLIAGINGLVLVIGVGVIWWMNRPKRMATADEVQASKPADAKQQPKAKKVDEPEPSAETAAAPGRLASIKQKLTGLFKRKPKVVAEEDSVKDDAGIIDLSLPDDR